MSCGDPPLYNPNTITLGSLDFPIKNSNQKFRIYNTSNTMDVGNQISLNSHIRYPDYNYLSQMTISKYRNDIDVEMDDDKIDTISREEIVKYIGERKLREENELIHSLWDRYQVAVKLVGSVDNERQESSGS